MDSHTGEECVCQQCDMLVSSSSGSGSGSAVAGTGATRAPDDGAPVSPDGFEDLLESMVGPMIYNQHIIVDTKFVYQRRGLLGLLSSSFVSN
jgi:hypothetical protein